jgi:hypothetical protein
VAHGPKLALRGVTSYLREDAAAPHVPHARGMVSWYHGMATIKGADHIGV